jgi:hypothetical protein
MLMPDRNRFDVSCESLCTALRWKGQFISAEHDDTVPPTNDGIFWCMHTELPRSRRRTRRTRQLWRRPKMSRHRSLRLEYR